MTDEITMMYLSVRKAQPVASDKPVLDATLEIRLDQAKVGIGGSTDILKHDAENIEELLHNHLPGGTYNALLRAMLLRTASQFKVSYGSLR